MTTGELVLGIVDISLGLSIVILIINAVCQAKATRELKEYIQDVEKYLWR